MDNIEIGLMDLAETAKYLGISKETLYLMVRKGEIPALKLGHLWKFKKETIDDWIDKKQEDW